MLLGFNDLSSTIQCLRLVWQDFPRLVLWVWLVYIHLLNFFAVQRGHLGNFASHKFGRFSELDGFLDGHFFALELDIDEKFLQNEIFSVDDLDHEPSTIFVFRGSSEHDVVTSNDELEPTWEVLIDQNPVICLQKLQQCHHFSAHPLSIHFFQRFWLLLLGSDHHNIVSDSFKALTDAG